MRRSFRTRGLGAWQTQSVALGRYALPLWGKRMSVLMPPPPPGIGIQGFTLRWYAVSLWDISSPQRRDCIPAQNVTPGTDGAKPSHSEGMPHREGNAVMNEWSPRMGKATASGLSWEVKGSDTSHLMLRFLVMLRFSEYLTGIFWLFGLSSNVRAPSQSPGSTPSVFPFAVGP